MIHEADAVSPAGAEESDRATAVPVLIVVEGTTDVDFLRQISAVLYADDESIPDLVRWERAGRAVFLPFGGGNVAAWCERLAPLRLPEFHLYDGELPPETAAREHAARLVAVRPRCRAAVTRKRSLENYLHPAAIVAAGGPSIEVGDWDGVATVVAQARNNGQHETPWNELPRRTQRALVHKTKRWLCRAVAAHMTSELLRESDPLGEVRTWLRDIAELASACSAAPIAAVHS